MNLTNLLTLICLSAVLAIILVNRTATGHEAITDALAMVTGDAEKKEAEAIGISPEELEILRPVFADPASVDDTERRLAIARYYGNLERARTLNEARADDLRWAQQVARRYTKHAPAPAYKAAYKSSLKKAKTRAKSVFERSQQYKANGSAYDNKSGRFRLGSRTLRGGGARR
jgi:hypothetical protein